MDPRTIQSLLNFTEGVESGLQGLEARAVFEQLEQRNGDIQLAMQWLVEQRRANEAFRLASSLVAFWMATKPLEEGSAWFGRILALPGGDDAHRGRAVFDAGYLAFWQGDNERSSALQNQAL